MGAGCAEVFGKADDSHGQLEALPDLQRVASLRPKNGLLQPVIAPEQLAIQADMQTKAAGAPILFFVEARRP